MAHYKKTEKGQGLFLTIDLSEHKLYQTDITYCKGITRFTLRTQVKVSIQWKLYCLVHNIGKCNMAEKGRFAA